MNVKLISITKPIIEGIKDVEELVVYCARVSNPANQSNMETATNLIKYLIKHKHWSPLDLVDMTVEIVTSRAIAQQILRHKSFFFQEFSQRYSLATNFESIQLRKQAEKNRQSSTIPIGSERMVEENVLGKQTSSMTMDEMVESHIKEGEFLYNMLIKHKVAKECARMILPLTTQTTLYMKGSCRSWVHYLQLRTSEDTQLEHREVATAIKNIFKQNFPNISNALDF